MRSEFNLIDTFLSAFAPPRSPRGPGDDCAVLPPCRRALCVTTDSVVEGVHFTLRHFSFEDVGHKALAVNLSDLAAMGARPRWFLCALALPRGFAERDVRALARGMNALARRHHVTLVGGNFTAARELSVTLTAAGEVEPGGALRRDRARPGDVLYVSGTLGDARLGLLHLRAGKHSPATLRQRRPEPKLALGRLARKFARAAMDISDGLAQDLGHLCRASGTGARLELARLPLSPHLARTLAHPRKAASFALQGGEDYELLLAVSPSRAPSFERACLRRGEKVTRVGVLTTTSDIVFLLPTGETLAPPSGYDHFA